MNKSNELNQSKSTVISKGNSVQIHFKLSFKGMLHRKFQFSSHTHYLPENMSVSNIQKTETETFLSP